MPEPPLYLLQSLLRQPTVGGTLSVINSFLRKEAFETEILTFHGISNLYAARFLSPHFPTLAFLGHADVVSAGEVEIDGTVQGWNHPPFSGFCDELAVFGRGAVDMKGAIACFLEALHRQPRPPLNIIILISGDEEGDGVWGTPAVLDTLRQQGRLPRMDFVLIGEPTSRSTLGDTVKIGCRGSCNITVTVTGQGGHVAYPEFLANPLLALSQFLCQLQNNPLGEEDELFGASHAEVTQIASPPNACNVVPETVTAQFNIRYNPTLSPEKIKRHCAGLAAQYPACSFEFVYDVQSRPFKSTRSDFRSRLIEAIKDVTGLTPHISASGASSDARFLPASQPFAELGLPVQQAHKINESVTIADLTILSQIYEVFMRKMA